MRRFLIAGGALVFIVLATLNAGGYRYGASDQAFYIPAILKQVTPALYPRDTALIGPQARYFFVDEIVAGAMRATGWSIDTWFAVGYLATLVVLYGALVAFAEAIFTTPLAVVAFVAAATLRHRITRTGVNTLEGYFHPRVLVFAVGVAALVVYLRGRPRLALALVAIAGLLHPTTAAFFVLVLLAAIATTEPAARTPLLAVTGFAMLIGAALVLAGPLRAMLVPMDAAWLSLLGSKDYLFPLRDWSAGAWLANLGTAAVAIGGLRMRVRAGVARPREQGLFAGAIVMLAGFLATVPLVAMHLPFFVQLQISRVFWLLELLAVAGAVWWLVDRPQAPRTLRIGVTVVLAAVSLGRGVWVGFVEHPERPAVQITLPDDDWGHLIRWLATTPIGTHVLADPGHAWKYGAPLRYAGRDVYLEEVKDTAMAIYSRDSAARVIERLDRLGPFEALTADRARALARDEGLDYLVTEREMVLPEVHREGRFHVYAMR